VVAVRCLQGRLKVASNPKHTVCSTVSPTLTIAPSFPFVPSHLLRSHLAPSTSNTSHSTPEIDRPRSCTMELGYTPVPRAEPEKQERMQV
jgi:hypothetical protein